MLARELAMNVQDLPIMNVLNVQHNSYRIHLVLQPVTELEFMLKQILPMEIFVIIVIQHALNAWILKQIV